MANIVMVEPCGVQRFGCMLPYPMRHTGIRSMRGQVTTEGRLWAGSRVQIQTPGSRPCSMHRLIARASSQQHTTAEAVRGEKEFVSSFDLTPKNEAMTGPLTSMGFSPMAGLLWLMWGGFIYWACFSSAAPGPTQMSPQTTEMMLHCSMSAFYVNPTLAAVFSGAYPFPDFAEHPVNEGLVTLVLMWTLLFGPFALTDTKTQPRALPSAIFASSVILFTTTLLPYVAVQTASHGATGEADTEADSVPPGGRAVGAMGLVVLAATVAWMLGGRSDLFSLALADRWQHAVTEFQSDKLINLLVLDLPIYTLMQAAVVAPRTSGRDRVGAWKYIPFVGMAVLLLRGPKAQSS